MGFFIGDGMADNKGFYLMSRGWMDNPAFIKGKFSQREAWIWMIEAAIFKDTHVVQSPVTFNEIKLKRGQFCYSRSYLAKAFGWSESSVTRFLKRLQNRTMVDVQTEQGVWLVTICNYNKYQGTRTEGDTEVDTEGDTEGGRNKNKGLNKDKYNKWDSAISLNEVSGAKKEMSETLAVETEEVKPEKFFDKERHYAVHGHVMKYTLADYERFKRDFTKWLEPYDFIRELESLDEWLFSLPKKDRKSWPIKIRRIMEKKYYNQVQRGLL